MARDYLRNHLVLATRDLGVAILHPAQPDRLEIGPYRAVFQIEVAARRIRRGERQPVGRAIERAHLCTAAESLEAINLEAEERGVCSGKRRVREKSLLEVGDEDDGAHADRQTVSDLESRPERGLSDANMLLRSSRVPNAVSRL